MFIKILFNTDGFLGGYIIPNSNEKIKKEDTFTQKKIDLYKKQSEKYLIASMTNDEFAIFHKATIARDFVEVLPINSKSYDLFVGNLKLKFNKNQNAKMYKNAQVGQAILYKNNTSNLNSHEKIIKEVYDVDKFKLIVNTEKGINQSYQNFTMYQRPNDRVAGFHVEGLKQIYVRYSSEKDKNGNPLPDFKTLGHELWHLIKGKYHN